MELTRVSLEAHHGCATPYISGVLAACAATRSEELMHCLPRGLQVLRVDLRAVDLIDPDSFVRLARALNRWRDEGDGRVTIEFPKRSQRRSLADRPALLVDQPDASHRSLPGRTASSAAPRSSDAHILMESVAGGAPA